MIFTSTVQAGLKETLNDVFMDETQNMQKQVDFTDWMEVDNQRDYWEDDQEYGGVGLAVERGEGEEVAEGTIYEGFTKRYIARSFARKIVISEEAIADNKYPKILDAAGWLSRSIWMTAQYDATFVLVRGYSSSYVGGDGVSLWNSAHTLPAGGTWSNVMATPMAPSRGALEVARAQVRHFPSQDGLIGNFQLDGVIFPSEQWGVWTGLLNSELSPEAGNFAEINVVRKLNIKPYECRYWTSSTTNWALKTDAKRGLRFRWRKKPAQRNWMENGNLSMHNLVDARWVTGWTDARSTLGVGS